MVKIFFEYEYVVQVKQNDILISVILISVILHQETV